MNDLFKKNNAPREAKYAGQFYPASKIALTKKLEDLFYRAEPKQDVGLPVQAVIAPHAGYVFSGKVAASAYNQIPENASYKRVFVLASSHRVHFNGAAVYTPGNYVTPLGEIETDTDLAKQLISRSKWFSNNVEAHEYEHSLEVELPFLQFKLKNNYKLVPIIVGTSNVQTCRHIAKTLQPYFTSENLFVVSTDFSHYPNYKNAIRVDEKTLDAITKNNVKTLLAILDENASKGIENLVTSLCGWTSVVTLLYLTKNRDVTINKIDYQNSADSKKYGDKERVVGYGALAVFNNENSFYFTTEEKEQLLKIARESISGYLDSGKQKKIQENKKGMLSMIAGAFVSIYINNELRGCIGEFARAKSLIEVVQEMAVSASRDRRFKPVQKDELDKMKLEISVLSPLKKIKSINEIEPGKHGIYIKKGMFSGTFLPQVATKTGWNVEELLGRCSRDKAGLGWEGWKTADVFVYEAQIVCD